MFADRKSSYKLPPTTITDRLVSQEARRAKALEDQKRRRALRVDSARHLDRFADLNLNESDDEDAKDVTQPSPAAVAPYAPMLEQQDVSQLQTDNHIVGVAVDSTKGGTRKHRKKRKNKNKPSKWADKCMYAELLEMGVDAPWCKSSGSLQVNDGLPSDLESKWVAVGPVPVGKRCLAVTHQSAGVAGVVPNTTLRSRLLGKVLIQRFPSVLPPLTILDCILDANWRENGILHVLDVLKWKGQDISDCEASFRFWWRDTRLGELIQSSPPSVPVSQTDSQPYHFPYPVTLLPVPYHADTTLATLHTQIIPLARSMRSIPVAIPAVLPSAAVSQSDALEGGMDVDKTAFSFRETPALISVSANVASDGLLLYVAEASYEAGISPLSSWIPIKTEAEGSPPSTDSPLDLFQRLVHRRLWPQSSFVADSNAPIDVDM